MSGADLLSFSVPEGKEKKCWVVGCILVLWCKAGFFFFWGGGGGNGGGRRVIIFISLDSQTVEIFCLDTAIL